MLNKLIGKFPDIKFEIVNGRKKVARVKVEYQIVGSASGAITFLQELESEWPFATQHCKGTNLSVEYLVRSEEVEEFVKKVRYRGEKVVVGF